MTPTGGSPGQTRVEIFGRSVEELEQLVLEWGYPAYHGRQLFRWLYQRRVTDFDRMTDLPRRLRELLWERATASIPSVARLDGAADGTRKGVLRLRDGEEIEAVLIPEAKRLTACLSTQAGCGMGCQFCLTATMGLRRNLTPGEIVGQLLALEETLGAVGQVTHLVFMGMGEPLANSDHTVTALRILTAPQGVGFSPRRVTLSTVGLVPGIRRLSALNLHVNLAVSLTATTDALRNRLMPINLRYPLHQLMAACREFVLPPRRRVTFEYVLLADVNDHPADAKRLVRLLRGIQAKVNLLPLNEAPAIPFRRPPRARVVAFRQILQEAGYTATIRESRGLDISAACGMLVTAPREAPPRLDDAAMGEAMLPSLR